MYGSTTIPAGASEAAILVTDASGQQIAQIPLSTAAGRGGLHLGRSNGLGERAPPGTYTFTAVANVGGATQQLETQLASYVQQRQHRSDN